MSGNETPSEPGEDRSGRRAFLSRAPGLAMAGGLAASYGTLASMAGRFLYPPGESPRAWVFVTSTAALKPGDSMPFQAPSGASITLARTGNSGGSADFLALSSTCPHLGCKVHWEPQKGRFFCPCHNGTFDPTGVATGGPPAEAGQSLPRYPLRVENGLLFIEVEVAG